MRPIYFLGILIILSGCTQKQEPKQDSIFEHNILLAESVGKYTEMELSSIVSKLEYIPLETRKSSLMVVDYVKNLIVTNDLIFIGGVDYLYAFSRDGKFLNKIGDIGNGPGEYRSVWKATINKVKQTIFAHSGNSNNMFEYTWDGKYLGAISIPDIDDDHLIGDCCFIGDNMFIGRISNKGNADYNFVLFDDRGEIIKLFSTSIFFPISNTGKYNSYGSDFNIYQLNDRWYLKEGLNDTLFYLNLERTELLPSALFNSGKYRLLDKISKDESTAIGDAIIFRNMVGSSDFLFFTMFCDGVNLPENRRVREVTLLGSSFFQLDNSKPFLHRDPFIYGVYDMKNKKTTLLENDPCGISGFINDLDGGLPFWPMFLTDDNKLVSILSAEDLKEILTEEYFATHEIKDKQAHQKLRDLLKNLKEDDNPVVVIATLK